MNDTQSSAAESIRQRAEMADKVPVRIALFGQPGAGKSSLINAIVGGEKAKVGVETDTTEELEQYDWNGIYLCDLPGYGTPKFPADSYMARFKIPSFDIFLCVSSGKFVASDIRFYKELRQLGKHCIFVRNKSDTLFQKGVTSAQLQRADRH